MKKIFFYLCCNLFAHSIFFWRFSRFSVFWRTPIQENLDQYLFHSQSSLLFTAQKTQECKHANRPVVLFYVFTSLCVLVSLVCSCLCCHCNCCSCLCCHCHCYCCLCCDCGCLCCHCLGCCCPTMLFLSKIKSDGHQHSQCPKVGTVLPAAKNPVYLPQHCISFHNS